eukprot:7051629-Prorocentrum_lima.AAC.1
MSPAGPYGGPHGRGGGGRPPWSRQWSATATAATTSTATVWVATTAWWSRPPSPWIGVFP